MTGTPALTIPVRAGGPPPLPGVKTASPPSHQYSFPKSNVRVLLLENVHPTAVDMFRDETYDVETVGKALSEDELAARIAGVHILGVRSKTRVTAKVLAASTRLLAIGCFCIGTDQVDLEAAEDLGVPVFNAPYGNTRSVAELVLAEVVALSRRLADQSKNLHAGEWTKSAAGCNEVRGKTLGIVGFGHIGSQLCIMAEAMGMQVLYHDVVSVLPIGRAAAAPTLAALLAASDFVSLHVPQSPATHNLIAAAELAQMKPGAKLINASRGTVVDIGALAAALASGHLGGAAVDVFPSEPATNGPGFESPLRGLPNVILTPHVGGSTAEAQLNIGREVAAALANYVNLGSTSGAVNFPQLDMPFTPDSHRVLNVHKNVPGVLRDVNMILSENDANVRAQLLGTSAQVGYIIIDLDKATGASTKDSIAKLETSIATRILY